MDGLVEIRFRLLPLTTRQADDGSCCPRMTVIGVYLQTLVQGLHRLGGVFQLHVDLCPHRVAVGVLRPSRYHCVELSQGTVIVLATDIAQHTVVPKSLILRVVFQCFRIVGSSLFELVEVNTTEPSQLIRVSDIGIALDGLGTVTLSPGKIIKVILGHPTEEPRLIEVGLGRDGLVEILDTQHIVLIIER